MGKHILITGGSDGLGKAVAANLQQKGNTVTILGYQEEKTKKVAKEMGVEYVIADVRSADAVERAVQQAAKKSGDITTLITSAGFWIQGNLEENSNEDIARTIDVNVTGVIYAVKAVVEGMKRNKRGRIILVNSQGGYYGKAARTVYTASKWAITGFTKSLQPELRPHGISVTGFYPGAMATGFFEKVGIEKDTSNALKTDEVAEMIAYIVAQPDNIEIPEFGALDINY